MLRIKQAFENKAKIAYLTAGDGGIEQSLAYFLALVEAGVNLLEIGIPYSDPVADGPVIQQAMHRALMEKIKLDDVLYIVSQIRAKTEVAIILFTYYNPIHAQLSEFLVKVKASGADGLLVVDLPYEEAANYRHYCKCLNLAAINVIAPSTSKKRMQHILAKVSDGFIYYACQKGTTGVKSELLPSDLIKQVATLRSISSLPIAVGFGIANVTMLNKVLDVADGAVVGSLLVAKVATQCSALELMQFAKELYNVT